MKGSWLRAERRAAGPNRPMDTGRWHPGAKEVRLAASCPHGRGHRHSCATGSPVPAPVTGSLVPAAVSGSLARPAPAAVQAGLIVYLLGRISTSSGGPSLQHPICSAIRIRRRPLLTTVARQRLW